MELCQSGGVCFLSWHGEKRWKLWGVMFRVDANRVEFDVISVGVADFSSLDIEINCQ
jgi:hypothetical protein